MVDYLRRRPLTAFVLSFLTTGLGQLYNGQWKKAFFLYFVGLCIFILPVFFDLLFFYKGLIICVAIILGYKIIVMIEAAIAAKKIHYIIAEKYNKWYLYLLIILINTLIMNVVLKPIVIPVKACQLCTDSMAPTMLFKDRVIGNKNYYTTGNPQRRDIVIFTIPQRANENFLMREIRLSGDKIKRVIGLPGETIEIIGKSAYINGQPLEEPYVMRLPKVELPPAIAAKEKFGPVTVPDGKIFVLGDNRNHSIDSRHFGFIDITALKGKALYIYWSKDKKRIGSTIN